jgi:cephalosporin hydroxylase
MNIMMDLVEEQYGIPGCTDKEGHKYFSEFYADAFDPFKDKPITLLEIGSAYGGSLIIWHEFFSQAQIIGAELRDHTPEGKKLREQNEPDFIWYNEQFLPDLSKFPRMTAYNGYDAYTESFANNLPNLDIVIDDGWHSTDQWEKLYNLYLPKINPGGMLIIEDIGDKPINCPADWTINDLIEPIKNYKHEIVDLRPLTGKNDSRILAIYI